MTQVDPNPPNPSALQQPAPITEASLWERVCVQVSAALERQENPVRFGMFALGHLYVFWKGEPNSDGSVPARGVTVYERGKPAPIKPSLGIMALFGFADDFVRVYALPIDVKGGDIGPARITLSRTAVVPSAFVEYMPMDQFISEIAAEVVNDLGGGGDEEGDEEGEEEGEEEEDGFTPT
jgi:hypothetical protein